MANLYGTAKTTTRVRKASGTDIGIQATPDGSVYTADWILGMALEGRLIHCQTGAGTTPVTFKTGYTAAQPELNIDVPTGTTIVPVKIQIYLETTAGTINEVVAVTGTNTVGAGTSTPVTPLSTRTDRPITSACTVSSLYSGNGTALAGLVEFWREGYAFIDVTAGPQKLFEWSYSADQNAQVIVGPGALSIYAGATSSASTGYIKVTYVELTSSSYA